ncbi:MAG: hypothetical protein M1819_004828 [Sarea resinae]|nr:MAG: hypothetical protein M1819_004828 [Sarea resinae]
MSSFGDDETAEGDEVSEFETGGESSNPLQQANSLLKVFDAAKKAQRPAYFAAPMVRYSKLPFRALVRSYNVDVCYTPMILAKEFNRSELARDSDFTTNAEDRPLVVQFGANSGEELSRAAELVQPYCDGIDLNCGCPQSWACQEGLGAHLMEDKRKVHDMIRAVKVRCGQSFSVSVKIRVHADLKRTVEFVRAVEAAGVDYIGCHGRRRSQKSSEPVDLEAIRLVKEVATVPIVANGDAFSLEEADYIASLTGANGVMSARGLLENPALFVGHGQTPWDTIERFLGLAVRYPLPYRLALHHISEMGAKMLSRQDKAEMLDNRDMLSLVDWLESRSKIKRL